MQRKRKNKKKGMLDYIFYILVIVGFLWTVSLWVFASVPSQKSRPAVQSSSSSKPIKQALSKSEVSKSSKRQSSRASSSSDSQSGGRTRAKLASGKFARGTTLSSDQPYSDYSYLRAQGLSFVYFRATTGGSDFDDLYMSSLKSARDAGLSAGAVLIYDSFTTAYAAYLYFVQNVGRQVGNLPIAISVTDDDITDNNSIANLRGLILDLRSYYPKNSVIVRCDKAVYDRIQAQLAPLNMRYWLLENSLDNTDTVNQFVQYNANGKVGSGIRSFRLPLSIFNGRLSDLKNLSREIEK
ncbi:GH25 family lysozyme [Oenococcus sp.]|uniref:GH25 family lysozyme n=1 Tax=Oenococcus sp. TaxID=1979414 RepID=UPI0039EBB844